MKSKKKRFEVKLTGPTIFGGSIIVDTETGVNYLFYANGNVGGITPLLNKDGSVVITEK